MNKILTWLILFCLEILLKRAESAAEDARTQAEEDRKRGEINHENLSKYEQAQTREQEIAACSELLNGTLSK